VLRTVCCVLCMTWLQGFGNVGAWAADILADMGGKVTAVSDVSSAIVNESGLDIRGLRAHLATGGERREGRRAEGAESRDACSGRGGKGTVGCKALAATADTSACPHLHCPAVCPTPAAGGRPSLPCAQHATSPCKCK
jgi:hypothetical protein